MSPFVVQLERSPLFVLPRTACLAVAFAALVVGGCSGGASPAERTAVVQGALEHNLRLDVKDLIRDLPDTIPASVEGRVQFFDFAPPTYPSPFADGSTLVATCPRNNRCTLSTIPPVGDWTRSDSSDHLTIDGKLFLDPKDAAPFTTNDYCFAVTLDTATNTLSPAPTTPGKCAKTSSGVGYDPALDMHCGAAAGLPKNACRFDAYLSSLGRSAEPWRLVFESKPEPTFPWDVVDADPAVSPPRDANGFRLNPRWKWQMAAGDPPAFGNCPGGPCTSQPTRGNRPERTFPITCGADVLGLNARGHLNWEVVTYTGKLEFEDHSEISRCTVGKLWEGQVGIPSPDDDYNILIDTPETNGRQSGSTADNDRMKIEFRASETIDRFIGIPYWSRFRHDVDDCSHNPQGVKGQDGIVIGMLGLDEEHDHDSEIHPAFGLAIHSNNALDNDVWDIFARNFGGEGYCSGHQEYLGQDAPTTMTFKLPRPAGVAAGGPTFSWNGLASAPPPQQADVFSDAQQDVFVTFHLPAPPQEGEGYSQVVEIRLNWTGGPAPQAAPAPAGARAAAAPASAAPTAEDEEGEDTEEQLLQLASQMTPEQLAVLEELSPKRQAVAVDSVPLSFVVHSGLPPLVSAPPATESAYDPSLDQNRRDVVRAFCGALGGQLPIGPGVCSAFSPVTLLTNTGTVAASGWFTTPVTVTLTAVDAGGNGIGHTEYSFDNVSWTTYTGPFVLPEGDVTVQYRTVDAAGTFEPVQQREFKIDTRPPSSSASDVARTNSVAFAFTVSDPQPGSGPAGLFSRFKVNDTSTVTQFTAGASGMVDLPTLCTAVEYWAQDVAGNLETPHQQLPDSKPPVLTLPPNVTTATCSTSALVAVGQATASDDCVTPQAPKGRVIASNGLSLPVPLPVVGGQVTLGIGTHVIEWTVSDGTNTVSGNQTVVIGTKIQTTSSFLLRDGSSLTVATGESAAMLNSGSGLTEIGNGARTGAVMSVGPVRILHRAVVSGDVTSSGAVFHESDATVTGVIRSSQAVVLPGAASLPTFPPPALGPFNINSGSTTLNPGSYNSVIVNGGTLVLGSGDYFFTSLTVNSSTTVRVTPTTRVFVRDSLILRSPFRATSGTAVQAIFLGFAGTATLLEAEFDGTLLAPNATVVLGQNPMLTFTGSFTAKSLEVRPNTTLICR